MKTPCLAAVMALCAVPALAVPSDILSTRQADRFAAGRHQFYAWCANGQDRILRAQGASAAEARRLLDAPGCTLRWQGRAAL